MLLIAKNLDHAETRIVEKHYGHLAFSYIVYAIRADAPKFWVHGSTAMGVSGGKARSSTWYWWPNPLVAERGEPCSALHFIPHRAMARGRSDD